MLPRPPLVSWTLVVVVTVCASAVFGVAGLPSPVLFGALLGGMAHALTSERPLAVPPLAFRVGQGLVGVTIGAMVSLSSLTAMGPDLLAIVLVSCATLAVSLGAGWLLARRSDVSGVTGTFALVAGGASGVVAVAHELGADDRVVTVVQYLRVLAVLLTMPLVSTTVLGAQTGRGVAATADGATTTADIAFTVLALAAGLGVARLVGFPTVTLLGPLAAAVLLGSGWADGVLDGALAGAEVPTTLQWLAYVLIGVQVGLRFTRASLASIARMLPAVLLLIVGLVAGCAALGALLSLSTGVDPLTAYLATTPGGLFAVLATAADSGSDVTYVTAVQVLRLLVVLLLTPWLASRMHTARRGR